jgi:hypothetical protein
MFPHTRSVTQVVESGGSRWWSPTRLRGDSADREGRKNEEKLNNLCVRSEPRHASATWGKSLHRMYVGDKQNPFWNDVCASYDWFCIRCRRYESTLVHGRKQRKLVKPQSK